MVATRSPRNLVMAMRSLCLALVLLGWCGPVRAAADSSSPTARVSHTDGRLMVRGIEETEFSYVGRNGVLRAGDLLLTDERSRAEIELAADRWLRLDETTRLELVSLADPTEVRLWNGQLYVQLGDRIEAPLVVRTPPGDVVIEADSTVRIEALEVEQARIAVLAGSARAIATDGSEYRIGDRREAVLHRDGRPVRVTLLADGEDAFDRWNRDRVRYFAERPIPRPLERPLLGARELSDYGSWLVIDGVTYWRPRIGPTWRPYCDGYWTWIPGCGLTWVPDEPWGYVTCHYGRWYCHPVYGWVWCPRYVWGPSWVSFGLYDDYVCWAPLDPWDRPCYLRPIYRWRDDCWIDPWVWSYCPRDRFYQRLWHPWDRARVIRPLRHISDFRGDRLRALPLDDLAHTTPREPIRGLRTLDDRSEPAADRAQRLGQRLPAVSFPEPRRSRDGTIRLPVRPGGGGGTTFPTVPPTESPSRPPSRADEPLPPAGGGSDSGHLLPRRPAREPEPPRASEPALALPGRKEPPTRTEPRPPFPSVPPVTGAAPPDRGRLAPGGNADPLPIRPPRADRRDGATIRLPAPPHSEPASPRRDRSDDHGTILIPAIPRGATGLPPSPDTFRRSDPAPFRFPDRLSGSRSPSSGGRSFPSPSFGSDRSSGATSRFGEPSSSRNSRTSGSAAIRSSGDSGGSGGVHRGRDR